MQTYDTTNFKIFQIDLETPSIEIDPIIEDALPHTPYTSYIAYIDVSGTVNQPIILITDNITTGITTIILPTAPNFMYNSPLHTIGVLYDIEAQSDAIYQDFASIYMSVITPLAHMVH